LSSVACQALQYFPAFSHKQHDFMTKQIIENKMCFFLFLQQILSEIYFNITRTERDIIKNVYRPLCKVPVIFVRVE